MSGRAAATLGALVVCGLAAAGCGDGDPGDLAAAERADGVASESPSPTVADPVPDGVGPDRAVVTIGDQRFESDLAVEPAFCVLMGGGVVARGAIDGFSGASIEIEIPPEQWEESPDDWDPPSIRLALGEGSDGIEVRLDAGGADVDGHPELEEVSQVDSYEIAGSYVSGTAVFVDTVQADLAAADGLELPSPRLGTFEVNCG